MGKASSQILIILSLVVLIVLLGAGLYYQHRVAGTVAAPSSSTPGKDPSTVNSGGQNTEDTRTPLHTSGGKGTSAPAITGTRPQGEPPTTPAATAELPPPTSPPATSPTTPPTTSPTTPPTTPGSTTPLPPPGSSAPDTSTSDSRPIVPEPDAPLICLDPGHGFEDPGALGTQNGKTYYESDINLAITLLLKKELEARGFRVILTHDGVHRPAGYLDKTSPFYNVNRRRQWILDQNAAGAGIDAVISIHCNSADSSKAAGTRYYIDKDVALNTPSGRLMNCLRQANQEGMGLSSLPNWYNGDLMVLRTPLPSVLIECGFVTNAGDLANLLDPAWQARFAASLADGVKACFFPDQK